MLTIQMKKGGIWDGIFLGGRSYQMLNYFLFSRCPLVDRDHSLFRGGGGGDWCNSGYAMYGFS